MALVPSAVAQADDAAAAPRPLFAALDGFVPKSSGAALVVPKRSSAYRVDLSRLRAALASAPSAAAAGDGARPLRFAVPDPTGRMMTFELRQTRVMQAALAARHPEIATYSGSGITDPTATISLDVTPLGFHASVVSANGQRAWYVDPAYKLPGTTTHLSYFRSALPEPERRLVEADLESLPTSALTTERKAGGELVTRRTYRLALVTDQSYAAYWGSGNVLAAKTTLINRVNQLYNDDLAIRMLLVNGTDKLNLDSNEEASGPNGPCGANPCFDPALLAGGCTGSLLDRNEFVLGQLIGADKFDVGHIGLGIDGGGIAGLGVVGEQYKADGCTGLPTPKGDFYAVDYVAHEIGHQFGGNHTFNGTLHNCSLTNRNGDTSVEPGSGSSVMAYAGICRRDNLQPHSDPYFSQRSIDEITAHVTSDPNTYDEQQVVNLSQFDASGDSFQLTYPGATPVTITRGAGGNYNALGISAAVQQLTGELAEVSGYDGEMSPGTAGFTLDFSTVSSGVDLKPFGVVGTGDTTGFVGTVYNGGPGTNQGTANETGNHAPEVFAPADKTIPLQTPFTLTATGSDSDGSAVSYLWEQNDAGNPSPNGGTPLLSNDKSNGPLFRVFGTAAQVSSTGTLLSPSPGENLATTSGSRTFPDMQQILAGTTNANTGDCPLPPAAVPEGQPDPIPQAIVDCYSEFLPTSAYGNPLLGGELNFRVTARDGSSSGGGTAYDDVTLTLSTAGPLKVTSQSTPVAVIGGETGEVRWNVNGTNAADLAPQVRISLSVDGGQTYPHELVASTPNDGAFLATWPNVATDRARIKVESVGNYFFDLNDSNFSITSPITLGEVGPQTVQYSDAFDPAVTITATADELTGDQLSATVEGVEGLTVTRTSTSGNTAEFRLGGAVDTVPGVHDLVVTVTGPGQHPDSATRTIPVSVGAEDAIVAYTGTTEVGDAQDGVGEVLLSAAVTAAGDGTPGDITTATVTFVDRGTGDVLCSAPVTDGTPSGSGSAACVATMRTDDGTDVVVGSVVGGSYVRDSNSDDVVITVADGDPDTTSPETWIQAGPDEGGFFLGRRAVLKFASSNDTVSYRCRFDRKRVPCDDGRAVLDSLSNRNHVFTVAAVDEAGNIDPSPARRTFVSPFAQGQLDRKGAWQRHGARSAYRGMWVGSDEDGASLSRRADGVRRVAVVAGTGPAMGRVAVYLADERIGTVNLRTDSPRARQLFMVRSFDRARSGVVRLEVLGDRPVRIEGLGLA